MMMMVAEAFGPAAISFSNGITVGSILYRNGPRPACWVVTRSGLMVLASKVGVRDIPPEDVLQKRRLAPGKMFLAATAQKRIVYDNEVKAAVSRRKPYRRWLFGYTREGLDMVITPMVEKVQEPISSMGNDQSLAVLSGRLRMLSCFKPLFAQVTNPPIDPYRENLVMSLMSYVVREKNLLDGTPRARAAGQAAASHVAQGNHPFPSRARK